MSGRVDAVRATSGSRGITPALARVHEGVTESSVLPSIDLAQLASYLDRPAASQAIREYRAALLQA